MPNHADIESLAWGDAIFLYLEREGAPLHIASVNVFEGRIPLTSCRRFIESKLPLIPRYRQRVVIPPFNMGLPTWEYDPEFDIRNHVRALKLRRGTLAELQAAVSKILTRRMDRRHPLWDFTLFPGLKGKRTGILARVHHCLADGIAGVGLMNVIMDASPITHPLPKRKHRFHVPPPKDDLTLLLDGWLGTYAGLVQRLFSTQSQVAGLAEKVVAADGRWPMSEFIRRLPELAAPTERLRFNVMCRGPQKFLWAEVPLAQIKAVRQAWGATVNDVVLALVTATVRRYLQSHGDPVRGRLFRMMVPVNVRGGSSLSELGNRISLLPVTVPLDIRSPRRLVVAVHERMEFLKTAHIAEIVGVAGGIIGVVPTALQALAGPVAAKLPITAFNLVCTNVPGPQVPLYLLGHKMLSWYPYVPIGGEMALNCAVLSYNGVTYFGFTGDAHVVPDLKRIEVLLAASLREMAEHAAQQPPQRTQAPPPEVEAQQMKKKKAPAVPMPVPSATSAAQPAAGQKPTSEAPLPKSA